MLCAEWCHISGQHPVPAACAQTSHALVAARFDAKLGTSIASGCHQQFHDGTLYLAMAVSSIHHKSTGQLPLVSVSDQLHHTKPPVLAVVSNYTAAMCVIYNRFEQ